MKMNKLVLATSLAMGMSMASFAHAAAPVDQGHGTVTFTGAIINSPCSIHPDSVDQTVNLGQISSIALKDGGKSSPKPFQVKLENCDITALSKGTVTTTFTGAEGVDGRLGIDGVAKGASIALTNGAGKPIVLGTATDPQKIQNGNNTLEFAAYLQGDNASGGVVPGEFHSVANFTLAYL